MRKLKLLIAACALLVSAGVQAQKDVTSQYITNATLSNGTTGWTVSNFNNPQSGNFNSNGRYSYNTKGYASEAYSGWGSFDPNTTPYYLKQTITLPAGHYTLVNYSFYREGESYNTDINTSRAKLFAGSNEVYIQKLGSITAAGYANSQAEGAIVFDSKMYRNAVDFTIDADNTEIEIGLTGTFEIMRSWCIAGMFELINNDIPATMDAPFDVTGYITNPGFEYRDMTGWEQTPSNFFGTQKNNQSFKTGEYFAEKWQPSSNGALGEGSFSQTLENLPAGFYKLTVNLGGNGTYVSLNGKTANWTADKDYTVGYVLAENENLTITAGKTAEGTANWIHFDNFRLQFCGDVAAALTTLCAKVTDYEAVLPADAYQALAAQVAQYNKTYSDVDELLAAIDAVQALYDAADLYVAYAAALAAAQAIDQTAPMNADVLSALQDAKATQLTLQSTAAEAIAATNALETATANATTSIANYIEAKAILDAANGYDATGQASYAANETIAAIKEAYNNRTLTAVNNEQKSAAAAALTAACKAQTQPADGCDMTACIVNPNIDGNVNGWTCEKKGVTDGTGGPLKPSNDAMEYWGNNTLDENASGKGFDYYQTINELPNGAYTISADLLNSTNGETGANWNGGGNAGVYGKTASDEVLELVYTDGEVFTTYTTDVILVVDGELRIGVKNINPLTGRWFAADNFKLTYARQLTEQEETNIAKAIYDDALLAAQDIEEGTIPTAAYIIFQQTIAANTLTEGTAAQYEAAAAAINGAVETAKALQAPYATWLQLKDEALALASGHQAIPGAIGKVSDYVETLTTVDNLNTANEMTKAMIVNYSAWYELKISADELVAVSNNNDEANATLQTAIETQFNNISTQAQEINNADISTSTGLMLTQMKVYTLINTTIPNATTALKEAMTTYVKTAEPTNGECFDLTFLIVNPHFKEGEGVTAIPTGWTLESGEITEHRLETHNFEAYHKLFNLSQTIPDLPKGTYKVTLQGFARHDGSDIDKTNLYCGIVNQPIKNITDEYSETSIFHSPMPGTYCPLWNAVEANYDTEYTRDGQTVYQPNGMTGSYYWFQEINTLITPNQPFYTNEVQTLVPTAGDLKIGFKCETNTDWVIWDNFHLYYYGSPIVVTIDENEVTSVYEDDIENANVTLKRTFNAGKWNTISLPFDLTDAETKTAFGSDAEVATYSETAEGIHSTITFSKAEDAAITANKPVLLKTSTTATEFIFNGKIIKAGEAKVEGINFDFVGTYAASTTIAQGDYFISNNQLWESTGNTTIKGTRAYIKDKGSNAEARIAKFIIDGQETTAIEGLEVVKSNNNGKIYNLNGQEVKKAQKGLYIQNGKKVVLR